MTILAAAVPLSVGPDLLATAEGRSDANPSGGGLKRRGMWYEPEEVEDRSSVADIVEESVGDHEGRR
jgi:hypothetical protein